MLVSIPQPDNEQHFNRPYKFAFLRRGPFEVCDIRHRTVMLRDYNRARAGEDPQQFLWPKYNLAPYYQQSDILPPTEPVIHMPFADELEPVPVAVPPQLPSAIVSCRSLPEPVVAGERHVRNQEYLVRWTGRSHNSNSYVPYDTVWSSPAFQEFVQGSQLTGHIPPQQFQAAHVAQINALLRGRAEPGVLPMADPPVQLQVMRQYFPASDAQRPNAQALGRLQGIPPMQLSQDIGPPSHSPQPQNVQQEVQRNESGLRRSSRPHSQRQLGEDFVAR
jgi:hypothetical protein